MARIVCRASFLIFTAAALATACNKSKDTSGTAATDTSETPSGSETGDTSPSGSEPHPLIPDEFQYLWDTDGCTTLDGAEGVNVYWYAVGSADDAGDLTMTEQWFWFMGQGDYSQDCVDTFEITGTYDAFDYNALGCGACEEGYAVTRTLVDSTCGVSYHSTFNVEEEPEEQVYEGIEMLDTLTPFGKPNWEMDVSHADPVPPGQYSTYAVTFDWADGHAYPYGEPGYPSDYEWVGEACYTIN